MLCKLAGRNDTCKKTVITVGDAVFGGEQLTIIAGPCAVEDRDGYIETALKLKETGARMLRGGAFKPRTSPYSFQGLEAEGLTIMAEARDITGLPVVTEIMDTRDIELVAKYSDVVQIGSRNMQNFVLLKEVGRIDKPVLLKRGLSATIEEWLMAAEYILSEGNSQVIMCERGIRTFETHTRNTLDISAVLAIKELSHLPVIVDPSHASGIKNMVGPLSKAAVAAGADGLIIEVHNCPDEALCDGKQSLTPEEFGDLTRQIAPIAKAVGRKF
ncbi:MAG TPA: 3-deoxy-7-phosphoheptulonate synthase [Desulfobacteria bacterium]|nr:3-deoxy-7-phosphoheptulonate synthase [Desulfobacteria bacterium]